MSFIGIEQKFYIRTNKMLNSKERKSNVLGFNLVTAPPGVDSVEMDLESILAFPKEIKIH